MEKKKSVTRSQRQIPELYHQTRNNRLTNEEESSDQAYQCVPSTERPLSRVLRQ